VSDKLRGQLEAAVQGEAERHHYDPERFCCSCGFGYWSPEHVAVSVIRDCAWALVSAALDAREVQSRTDERTQAQKVIEAERLRWDGGPSDFNQGRDVGFILAAASLQRLVRHLQ
jgi:hypothetical protein